MKWGLDENEDVARPLWYTYTSATTCFLLLSDMRSKYCSRSRSPLGPNSCVSDSASNRLLYTLSTRRATCACNNGPLGGTLSSRDYVTARRPRSRRDTARRVALIVQHIPPSWTIQSPRSGHLKKRASSSRDDHWTRRKALQVLHGLSELEAARDVQNQEGRRRRDGCHHNGGRCT